MNLSSKIYFIVNAVIFAITFSAMYGILRLIVDIEMGNVSMSNSVKSSMFTHFCFLFSFVLIFFIKKKDTEENVKSKA